MSDKRYILVTGANGFIGKALSQRLKDSGFNLRVAVRQKDIKFVLDFEEAEVGYIGLGTDWTQALAGIDIVIHLAGRAHITSKSESDSLDVFRKVNTLGTERLARMSAKAGVKRFIFISSVKVNGEGSLKRYTEVDNPDPQDTYGISKREAEDVLRIIAADTGMEVVILRLPLVYGPGVKANFKNLIKISTMALPLPLKSINNQRSFIYLGNLVDAISLCIRHPLAANQTFLVSDGEDVSTLDLIKIIANAAGKKLRLFALPQSILRILFKIVGKEKELEKLTGTLLIDSSKIRNVLGWRPPFTLEQGIKETVKNYHE